MMDGERSLEAAAAVGGVCGRRVEAEQGTWRGGGFTLQRRSRQSATRETKASLMTRQPWSRAREEEKKEASGRWLAEESISRAGKEETEAGLAGSVAARGRRRRSMGSPAGAAAGSRGEARSKKQEGAGRRRGRALGDREGEEEIERREMGIGAPGGAGWGIGRDGD